MKRLVPILLMVILTTTMYSQDSKISRLSYSFAWTPIYYGPNDYAFRLDDILPITFEAKLHFKILDRVAVSSGIGFQEWHRDYLSWGYLSVYDPTKSEKWSNTVFRVPIQINYFMTKNDKNLIPYFKSEFINEFSTSWVRQYQDNLLSHSESSKYYSNTLDIGFGATYRISNSLKLFSEGSIGTHLYNLPFDGYQIMLKIGIMIK